MPVSVRCLLLGLFWMKAACVALILSLPDGWRLKFFTYRGLDQ